MEDTSKYQNNTRYFWAAIAILTMLSAGLGYLYIQEKNLNKLKQFETEKNLKAQLLAATKLDSMSIELTLKINEVQKLGGDVTSLKQLKVALEADKRDLVLQKNINIEAFDKKIKLYEVLFAQKDLDIIKLRDENGLLASENQALNNENSGLKTEKQLLADSIHLVSSKNKELSEKVNLASALHAESINVYAISARGKERNGGIYNARRVEKIRISFHLVDNPLTKQEEKEIFVRMLEPGGTVISDMATGSGVFNYKGLETIFTVKKREQFTNSHQLVEILFARGQEYRQGKYSIELYCEGYKIGQGSFDVKL